MKLNEFKELQELDMSHVIGSYGAAGLQQIGNRLLGRGEGQLSVKDKMAKNTYISNFVGRASTDLASAIEGGLVDPSSTPTSTAQPQQPAPQTGSTTQTTATAPQSSGSSQAAQLTPAQIRQQKQAQAGKVAQAQMKPASKPAQQPAQAAQLTPAQIRQQKQAAATSNAQQQMVPMSKLPANQPAIQAQNIRQQKQAAATASVNQQAAPFSKVPAAPAVWKNNRKPNNPAQTRPVFKESTFDKLNSIFESILRMDEADTDPQQAGSTKPSISSYVQSFFKKYMKNVNLNRPDIQSQIKSLADAVQASYKQDKGKAAFTKLANLGYALSYSDTGSEKDATTQQEPVGGLASAFAHGAGISKPYTTDATTATPGATTTGTTEPATTPQQKQEKEKSVYMQVKDLLSKLDKKGKQRILAALEKQVPATQATPEPSTEPSAMGNMAQQLSARGQTSTGGTQIATGRGVKHVASPTNPNQAPNLDAKIATATKRPIKAKTPKVTA